jgi:hypothetical protein
VQTAQTDSLNPHISSNSQVPPLVWYSFVMSRSTFSLLVGCGGLSMILEHLDGLFDLGGQRRLVLEKVQQL